MKRPKKPTLEQKLAIEGYDLIPSQWMVQKDTGGTYFIIVNKETGKTEHIDRYVRKPKSRGKY